jgi:hypothetical protein
VRKHKDPSSARRKFARDVAVSVVSSLILTGLARISGAWPRVVAGFDGNGWAAAGVLAGLLVMAFAGWWIFLGVVQAALSGPPSKLEGWSRIVDNVGAMVLCLMMSVPAIGCTILVYIFVFG